MTDVLRVVYTGDGSLDMETDELLDQAEESLIALEDSNAIIEVTKMYEPTDEFWRKTIFIEYDDTVSTYEDVAVVLHKQLRSISWPVNSKVVFFYAGEDAGGCSQSFEKLALPNRDTTWQELGFVRAPLDVGGPVSLPARLDYLAEWAGRFFECGGTDLWSVFLNEQDAHKFWAMLSTQDQLGLKNVRQKIINAGDHEWIQEWVLVFESDSTDDADGKNKVAYFLAILDQLGTYGFLAAKPGDPEQLIHLGML